MTTKQNLLSKKLCSLTSKQAPPAWAQIELTTICNLSCPSCPREDIIEQSGRGAQSLDENRLGKILSVLPGLNEIKFHGLGEPFLALNAPDRFAQLRRVLPDVHVVSITNANWPESIDYGGIIKHIDHLYISIDGHDRESYEATRRNGEFLRLLNRVQRIHQEKPPHLKISINSCFSADNYQHLYGVVILANSLDVKNVRFNLIQNWLSGDEGISKKFVQIRQRMVSSIKFEMLMDSVRYMYEVANQLGVVANIVGNSDFTYKQCRWSNEMIYVSESGDVLPCSMRCTPFYSFGNIFKQEFDEIWNGEKINQFRQCRCSEHPPKMCQSCPYLINAPILRKIQESGQHATKADYLYHD